MAESSAAKELVKRGDKLFALQDTWLNLWQELAEQFYPQRADFNKEQPWGEDYSDHLYDDAPVTQRRDLANNVAALLRPRGQQWFEHDLIDEDRKEQEGVRDYLERRTNQQRCWMYEPLGQFVRATKEVDHDFVTFGNAVVSVEAAQGRAGLIHRAWHLRDCAWAENMDGVVDTLHRKLEPSARQIKQRFGENVHDDIKKACDKDPEKTFKLRHVMMPIHDYEYVDAKKAKRYRKPLVTKYGLFERRYASVYIDTEHNEILSEEGSFEFRYVVARWQSLSGCPYAFSPATTDALAAARQLQVMARTSNEALEKSVDPAMLAAEKAIRGDINIMAAGITWFDADAMGDGNRPALELLQLGKDALLALKAIDEARVRLADATMVSKLRLPEYGAKEMTAFETQKRVEEYIRATIPVIEPWQDGYSALILDEQDRILQRMGAFGEVEALPDALSGSETTWTFNNPLTQTMEALKTQSFQTVVALATAMVESNPQGAAQIVNRIDWKKSFVDAARGAGAPEDWIIDEEIAAAADAKDAQIASLQQTIAGVTAAGEAAGAIGDGAASLSAAINGTANAVPA